MSELSSVNPIFELRPTCNIGISVYEPYTNAEHYMYDARRVSVHDSNDEPASLNKNCQLKIGKLVMIGT